MAESPASPDRGSQDGSRSGTRSAPTRLIAAPRPDGRRWYDEGEEPDYRFTLANERTFLAWIRTALALMAAAVAVVHLIHTLNLPGARRTLGTLLVGAALIISTTSYWRWRSVQRAMRNGDPLPRSVLLPIVAVVLTVAGILALVTVFV